MPDKFSCWKDLLLWLEERGMFHIDLGLERVTSALEILKLIPPAFPVIQVIGTNGKGSTATFLASLTSAHKLRCGLFLSPHFLSIEERIKIDGTPPPRWLWLECANIVYGTINSNGLDLTYFEFLTVLAMLLFTRQKVDLAVFEAGLGGKSDATTAIPASFQCFTAIDIDHARIIGPDLEHIAHDKAAAIQKNGMIFSGIQNSAVGEILKTECRKKDATLALISPMPELPQAGMRGKMQISNASLALALWRSFANRINIASVPELEARAIREAFIPGRLQYIPARDNLPPVVLDGAHNPHAMKALANELEEAPSVIIFSALDDKDWATTLSFLNRFAHCPFLIPQLDNQRAANPAELARIRNASCPHTARCFYGDGAFRQAYGEAVKLVKASDGYLLVTGSLYLLADYYKLFPQHLNNIKNYAKA